MFKDSYKELIQEVIKDIDKYKENDNFKNLANLIMDSGANVSLREHFLQQQIDLSWIEAIEKTIIPLDTILRSPRKFIKNEEDIVPIALARGITTDSIKHLAQHTNMIQSVENGIVTPNKILEVRKEESYETYENRFLFTLIKKISYFLDRRMAVVNETVIDDNQFEMTYNGKFAFNDDTVNYSISISYESKNRLGNEQMEDLLKQNIKDLTPVMRIERLRKIMYNFQSSLFMKNMANAAQIKPPLTMTNLLKKNPDYKACVDLWVTLESYRGTGVNFSVVNRRESPQDELVEKLLQFTALQYLYLKNYTQGLEEDFKVDTVENRPLERKIEEIVNSYDFDVDQVRKVFTDKVAKREKKKYAIEKRYIAIIRECLKDETDFRIKNDKKLSQDKIAAHARRRKYELLSNVQKHRSIVVGQPIKKSSKAKKAAEEKAKQEEANK